MPDWVVCHPAKVYPSRVKVLARSAEVLPLVALCVTDVDVPSFAWKVTVGTRTGWLAWLLSATPTRPVGSNVPV